MCNNPSKISGVGFVACRECWQCRETKIDDWVGRNIAESKTAQAAHVVTLTYGQDRTTGDIDHVKAAVLTYSDVQKYIKLLRTNGYPVRYFVVGEYGSLKGRAHWHIILYWQGEVPDHKLRENFMEKHWPHGWSYWDKSTPEAVRYACKYLLKDPTDENHQGWGPMPSKKPPLGHEYFRDLAEQYVQQGMSPQNLFYSFPDVRRVSRFAKAKGAKQLMQMAKPVQFHMTGKTADNFLGYFIERWRETYGDEPPRSDPVWAYQAKRLQSYLDGVRLEERTFDDYLIENGIGRSSLSWEEHGERLAEFLASMDPPPSERRGRGAVPVAPPFEGARVQFCEVANCYFTYQGDKRLWYSFDTDGDAVWHERIRPDANRLTDLKPRKRVLLSENPRVMKPAPKGSSSAYRQSSRGE